MCTPFSVGCANTLRCGLHSQGNALVVTHFKNFCVGLSIYITFLSNLPPLPNLPPLSPRHLVEPLFTTVDTNCDHYPIICTNHSLITQPYNQHKSLTAVIVPKLLLWDLRMGNTISQYKQLPWCFLVHSCMYALHMSGQCNL